jgi:RNA polymerase-binding transcription factor DksA
MADEGTDNFDPDFALSLVSSEQEALSEIQEAIDRIFDGTYGTCEITDEPISKERLLAVPFTKHSLEGQKDLEKNRRFSVQRGGVFSLGIEDSTQYLANDDGD